MILLIIFSRFSEKICYHNATFFVYFNTMATHSKYSNKQIELLMNEMIGILEKQQAPVDLSLIVLGDMVSNLLLSSVQENKRIELAEAFSQALLNSLKTPNKKH